MATLPQELSFYQLLKKFVVEIDAYSQNAAHAASEFAGKAHNLRAYINSLIEEQNANSHIESDCHVATSDDLEIRSDYNPSSGHSSVSNDHNEELVQYKAHAKQAPELSAVPFPRTPTRSSQHLPRRLSDPPSRTAGSSRFGNHNSRHSEPPPSQTFPQPLSGAQILTPATAPDQIQRLGSAEIERNIDNAIAWLDTSLGCTAVNRVSRGSQDPEHDDGGGLGEVPYDFQDGILRFRPTRWQWPCFDQILAQAKLLGSPNAGVFKIFLEHLEPPQPNSASGLRACSYRTQTRSDGVTGIELVEDVFIDVPLDLSGEELSTPEVVARLEHGLQFTDSLKDSRYSTDMPLRSINDRRNLGLSSSPIWPLPHNQLDRTRIRVPGIHWPYGYKANAVIGAVFVLRIEDFGLYSLNLLYQSHKIWIVIPPSSKDKLESNIRSKRSRPRCAQFVREQAVYVPTKILQEWNVPYQVVRQHPGEILVTVPGAYHQGFSVGSTLAEAVNYADEDWKPQEYNACTARTCPSGFIGKETMAFLDPGEEQTSEDEGHGSHSDPSTHGGSADEAADRTPQKQSSRAKLPKTKATRRVVQDHLTAKRKRLSDPQERSVKRTDAAGEVSHSLSSLSSTPKIPPLEIYETFCQLNAESKHGFDDKRCTLLTKLFFAIGSPDAICQLQEALHILRTADVNITSTTSNIVDSVRVLDRLDVTIHLYAILKRIHLVSLCRHRDNLLAETRLTRSKNLEDYTRVDIVVHRKMMSHAYPGLQPTNLKQQNGKDGYGRKSRALTDRFVAGQRWSLLAKAFSPGILALIPTRGEYQLSNSEYEKLPSTAIAMLIDVLKLKRGPFLQELSACMDVFTSPATLFPLEDEDTDVLKHEQYDSARLIELCKAKPTRGQGR